MLTRPGTSTICLKSRSSVNARRYFFALSAGLAGFSISFTYVTTLSNSVLKPEVKSCVPYSKSTMKQKVKNTNRANQKSPRSKDMVSNRRAGGVPGQSAWQPVKVRIEPLDETAMLFGPCASRFSI